MKIVILSQWYPPEPALLIQELAQTLQKRGNQVTVLTGFPNYPSGKLYPGYRLRLWQREQLAGISVVRVALYPEHSRSGLFRALNYLSFAISAALLGIFLVSRPDVIFVYHPPLTVGLPAWILSKLWRRPFVYQIQDMWPETLQATGMLNNKFLLNLIQQFASWVYQQANILCVISPGFQRNLLTKGVPQQKIRVISNWVDPEVYHPVEPDLTIARQLGLAEHFNVMFAGNIGEAQALQTLVEAALLLKDLPAIQFVLVGDGITLPTLKKLSEEYKLQNIRFLGRYPAGEMSKLYALADVLLVHLKDDPLFRITIPHKTFAYMASGKPILAAVTGDVADVIKDAEAGLTCRPEDPSALAATVRAFYVMPPSVRQTMGTNGLNAVQTKYHRNELVMQIESVLSLTLSN